MSAISTNPYVRVNETYTAEVDDSPEVTHRQSATEGTNQKGEKRPECQYFDPLDDGFCGADSSPTVTNRDDRHPEVLLITIRSESIPHTMGEVCMGKRR
uniref:Uncharacterized protein n=1 Tax=Steinernema glaseri TaxID=37863 RepID=A0A1I7YMQ3_9BILA